MTRHAPARSRIRHAPTLLIALLLLLAAYPAAPASAAEPPRVLPQLLKDAARRPEARFRVMVGRGGVDDAADLFVAARGAKKVKDVAQAGFVAEVAGKDLAELGRHPGVRWVTSTRRWSRPATPRRSTARSWRPSTTRQ